MSSRVSGGWEGKGEGWQAGRSQAANGLGDAGHSLGGALACLAALEIRQAYPNHPMTVYTFGTPRGKTRLLALSTMRVLTH